MVSLPELVSSVVKLVSLPEVYLRVRQLVDDPRAQMTDVAAAISLDPDLTSRLLRIANSAMFGFPGRVETVARAVTLLGTQQVYHLVLAASVTRAFAHISPALVDMQTFWRGSVYGGVVARLLARRCHVADVERLFVAGLLRDIGHLVLYARLPDQAQAALQQSDETGMDLATVERELFGFDYAEVGGALLEGWHVPETLHMAVRYHVEPETAPGAPFETAIVHIAGVLATGFLAGKAPAESVSRIHPAAWRASGLDPETVTRTAEQAAGEIGGVVELVVEGGPKASMSPPSQAEAPQPGPRREQRQAVKRAAS